MYSEHTCPMSGTAAQDSNPHSQESEALPTVPLCHCATCATVPLCHCATVPLCHCVTAIINRITMLYMERKLIYYLVVMGWTGLFMETQTS